MILQYIEKALSLAHYEIIGDDEPFYGEVPELEGVWACAKSLEACQEELNQVVEDWLLFSIAKGLPIASLDGVNVKIPQTIDD